MRDIGKNIRDLRQRKNMTQEMFAEKLFVTRQTVSNYETGKSRPDIDMLIRIAECLDTDVNTVLYGIPQQRNKRKRILQTCLCVGGAVLVSVVFSALDRVAVSYRNHHFEMLPYFLSLLFGRPLVHTVWGWTIVQCVSNFTGLKPLHARTAKKLRWVLWGIAALYLAVVIPELICIETHFSLPRFWTDLFYFLLGMHPYLPAFLKYIPITAILGVGIWLSGLCIKNKEELNNGM